MKKKLVLFMGMLLGTAVSMHSQSVVTPLQDWSTSSGSQTFFYKNVTKTSGANTFVAGATLNSSGNYDILVTKLAQNGSTLWTAQYNGSANGQDMATDLYIDASGNVYITGVVTNDAVNFYSDIITIKYNSSGTQQWVSTFNGSGSTYDAGANVFEDGSGNVYVCGSSYNSSGNTDVTALKYNSSVTQLWSRQFNGSGGLNDAGVRASIISGQLVVVGPSQTGTTTYTALTLSLNISTGAVISPTYSGSSGSSTNLVNDVVKDASGNIYIVGGTPVSGHGYDFTTIKLNSSMVVQWQVNYNGASSLDDVASGIEIDGSGNVYVTGYTTSSTQLKNMMTVKYNSSGVQQWNVTYNDALNGDDEANAIVLDASNNVYITGYDKTDINDMDYYTIKYNNSGVQQWSIRADGDAHLEDKATDIALDASSNIIVSGESQKANGTYEYKTIRYIQTSIITPADPSGESPSQSFAYYQNKGQLSNTSGADISSTIKYYTNNTSPMQYIGDHGSSYLFAHIDTTISTPDTLHRIDLTYDNNPGTGKAYSLETQQTGYLNYFLPSKSVASYTEILPNKRLVTPNLYTNIDLEYSSNQNGIKYYYIIKPGGSPTTIALTFTGASSFNLNGTTNVLTINSSIGNIKFGRPTVYQLSATNTIIPITTWTADWVVNGATNKYKFNIGTYDNTKTLIIEVDEGHTALTMATSNRNLNWSTYLGGNGNDYTWDAKTDPSAYLYVAGASSNTNFPVSSGTYSSAGAGEYNATATKFNSMGVRTWSTYIGGTGWDYGRAITYDESGNVYLAGYAGTSDFPTANPGGTVYYDGTFNGGSSDAFLVKFSTDGLNLNYGTFYGGNGLDRFTSIKRDGSGNIYLLGQTGSTDFPTQATGLQYHAASGLSGTTDATIVKFNSSNVRQWATYYGGSGASDFLNDLAFDSGNNLLIAGAAGSSDFPVLTPGTGTYYDGTFNGAQDAVVLKFLSTGERLWCTFYGGSASDDAQSIKLDASDNIFVGGSSSSTDLSTQSSGTAYYQSAIGGGTYDAMLLEFNNLMVRQWATYVGGNSVDQCSDITFDNHGVLYITGTTQGSGLPTPSSTPSGLYNQSFNGGLYDAYLMAFSSATYHNVWTTYLGGDQNENSYNSGTVVSDVNDKLFIAGMTQSDNVGIAFPLYDGGGIPYFDGTFGGGDVSNYDATVTRFNIQPSVFTGIEEIKNDNNLLVYPNPTDGLLNISYTGKESSSVRFIIYNTLGEIIKAVDLGKQSGDIFHTFDISDLSKGTYFLQVQTGSNTSSKTFIKQ